jgi:hypothetical protein
MNWPGNPQGFSLLRAPSIQYVPAWLPKSVLVVTILAGCGQSPSSAADLLNGVVPFNDLKGVALGTKARHLVEHRPKVNPAPYVGYKEQIGSYEVLYFFPGVEWNEDQVPPAGRKRIRAIEASRHLQSDTAVSQVWAAQFVAASRVLPVQPQCYRVPAGLHTDRASSTDRIATWEWGDQKFEIVSVGKRLSRSSTGVPEISGWIRLRLSRKPSFAENVLRRLTSRKEGNPSRIAQRCPIAERS